MLFYAQSFTTLSNFSLQNSSLFSRTRQSRPLPSVSDMSATPLIHATHCHPLPRSLQWQSRVCFNAPIILNSFHYSPITYYSHIPSMGDDCWRVYLTCQPHPSYHASRHTIATLITVAGVPTVSWHASQCKPRSWRLSTSSPSLTPIKSWQQMCMSGLNCNYWWWYPALASVTTWVMTVDRLPKQWRARGPSLHSSWLM